LNFLARAVPDAPRHPRSSRTAGWRRLTLSRHALILETSLSKPTELRLARSAVTAPLPARAKGSVEPSPLQQAEDSTARARLKHPSGCPGVTRDGSEN